MQVIFQEWITRQDLHNNRNKLYIFGDNMERQGLGGQAKEMRGEPNAIGIATKRSPGFNTVDFFSDQEDEFHTVYSDITNVWKRYQDGFSHIVYPSAGVGTGLAQLESRSPRIFAVVKEFEEFLERYTIVTGNNK